MITAVYEVRTYNRLCRSKMICHSREEIKQHINKVIKQTEKFLSTLSDSFATKHFFGKKITRECMDGSIEVMRIDPFYIPEWKKLIGKEKEITDPNLEDFEIKTPKPKWKKHEKNDLICNYDDDECDSDVCET